MRSLSNVLEKLRTICDEELMNWSVEKFNHQKYEGPAEEISKQLKASVNPSEIMISVGGTRYNDYGNSHYLKDVDKAVVVVYPEDIYSEDQILNLVESGEIDKKADISALVQDVIFK